MNADLIEFLDYLLWVGPIIALLGLIGILYKATPGGKKDKIKASECWLSFFIGVGLFLIWVYFNPESIKDLPSKKELLEYLDYFLDYLLLGMCLLGTILLILSIIFFALGAGGKSDKRFRTGRKYNDLGDDNKTRTGFLMLIAGILLWVIPICLCKMGIGVGGSFC